MLKRFGLPTVVLGTALSLLSPAAALARDHDRDRGHERREWRDNERHEWREHEWRERGPRFRFYVGPSYTYGPSYYGNGYYDQWGYWHPYPSGYYDRWGRWHPYGY